MEGDISSQKPRGSKPGAPTFPTLLWAFQAEYKLLCSAHDLWEEDMGKTPNVCFRNDRPARVLASSGSVATEAPVRLRCGALGPVACQRAVPAREKRLCPKSRL